MVKEPRLQIPSTLPRSSVSILGFYYFFNFDLRILMLYSIHK